MCKFYQNSLLMDSKASTEILGFLSTIFEIIPNLFHNPIGSCVQVGK